MPKDTVDECVNSKSIENYAQIHNSKIKKSTSTKSLKPMNNYK